LCRSYGSTIPRSQRVPDCWRPKGQWSTRDANAVAYTSHYNGHPNGSDTKTAYLHIQQSPSPHVTTPLYPAAERGVAPFYNPPQRQQVVPQCEPRPMFPDADSDFGCPDMHDAHVQTDGASRVKQYMESGADKATRYLKQGRHLGVSPVPDYARRWEGGVQPVNMGLYVADSSHSVSHFNTTTRLNSQGAANYWRGSHGREDACNPSGSMTAGGLDVSNVKGDMSLRTSSYMPQTQLRAFSPHTGTDRLMSTLPTGHMNGHLSQQF